jgi:hypothetical protein
VLIWKFEKFYGGSVGGSSVTTQLVDNFFSLRNIGINERQTTVDEVQHDDVNSIFITSEIIVLFYNGLKCVKKEFQCWGDEAKINHFRKCTAICKNIFPKIFYAGSSVMKPVTST